VTDPDALGPLLVAAFLRRARGSGADREVELLRLELALALAADQARRSRHTDRAAAIAQARRALAERAADALETAAVLVDYTTCLVALQPDLGGQVFPFVVGDEPMPAGRGAMGARRLAAVMGSVPLDRWVDLGAGDGRTAESMAARGHDVLAVDRRPQPLRAGVARVLVDGSSTDAVAAATVGAVGAGTAGVVSLFYPLHAVGPAGVRFEPRLSTALELLRPGGLGILVTEDPIAQAAAVRMLDPDERVSALWTVPEPLSGAQLRALAIEPYAPRWDEVATGPGPDASLGAFTWGLVVLFRCA
jgi:hypothetical protein